MGAIIFFVTIIMMLVIFEISTIKDNITMIRKTLKEKELEEICNYLNQKEVIVRDSASNEYGKYYKVDRVAPNAEDIIIYVKTK